MFLKTLYRKLLIIVRLLGPLIKLRLLEIHPIFTGNLMLINIQTYLKAHQTLFCVESETVIPTILCIIPVKDIILFLE